MRYRIRDYQQEAVDAVVSEFKNKDRALAVMACGTGKTLVALWIAERLNSKLVVVFVPSLVLMRQVLQNWSKQTIWPSVGFIACCSDDELINSKELELACQVTTDTRDIESFICDSHVVTKVILCTYQSSKALPADVEYDFAVFDEAHKTAHESEACFRYPLYDNNLFFRKRLFITATPKHYKLPMNVKQQNIAYSMDNENLYGKMVFRLDFAEAINKNIITDYKIVICCINDEQLRDVVSKNTMMIDKGRQVNSLLLAQWYGLRKFFCESAIKNCFCFHQTIKASKDFVAIAQHNNSDIELHHIDGMMSASYRSGVLATLRSDKKTIISNARCLTEGVDVPVVDCIAFMSPKKSKIDIVQIASRAMRKHKGKEFGYIFIPAQINNDNYEYIVNILHALMEYDSTLQESINCITKQGLIRDNGGNNKIMFLANDLDTVKLSESLQIKIEDSLADRWSYRFNQLKDYCKSHTGFDFFNLTELETFDKTLWVWVKEQRYYYGSGNLSHERKKLLDELNFIWNKSDEAWNKTFNEFKKDICKYGFKGLYGRNESLGNWFCHTREKIKDNSFPENRKRMFLEFCETIPGREHYIGPLTIYSGVFWRNYKRLEDYGKQHGHSNISESYDKTLYKWLRENIARIDKLPLEKQLALKKLNINFTVRESFDEIYEQVKNYLSEHEGFESKQHKLYRWIVRQRAKAKKGTLSKDEKAKLGELKTLNGFLWNGKRLLLK